MIGLGLQNSNKNRLFKLIKVYKIEKIPWRWTRRRRTAVQIDDQWTNQLTGNWRTIWLIVRWLIYWNERQENKLLRPMNLDNVCRRTLIWLCADGAKLRPSRIKTKKKKKHSLVINAQVRITHSQSKIVRLSLSLCLADICTSLVKRSNTYLKSIVFRHGAWWCRDRRRAWWERNGAHRIRSSSHRRMLIRVERMVRWTFFVIEHFIVVNHFRCDSRR